MNMKEDVKTLNVRIPKHIWAFAKKAAFEQNRSLNSLIVGCVESYKNKCENVLTLKDDVVL